MILSGILVGNILPWSDEITHNKMESCIADMHFRNTTETQFQECVTPDIEKIIVLQKLNALIAAFYSIGGIFVGLGIKTKLKSKKLVNKTTICNCGTVFRCPTHDK